MRRVFEWVAILVGIAILGGLGSWQLQRLAEKQDLIAKITARIKGPARSLEDVLRDAEAGVDVAYLPVETTGTFLHDREVHLIATDGGAPGWHIYTPLVVDRIGAVFVNRGFVPNDRKTAGSRSAGQLAGRQTVVGLVRTAETQGLFMPANDVARNEWYWRDLAGMAKTLDPSVSPGSAKLLSIDILLADVPGGLPKGGTTRLTFPNRHLEYALTWYALAATLIVFAGIMALRRRTPRGGTGQPGV